MSATVIDWREAYEDSAEFTEGPVNNYTKTFQATLRKINTPLTEIGKYKDCPKVGQSLKEDPFSKVKSVKPSRIGQTRVCKVVVEYSSEAAKGNNNPDPLQRPAVITMSTETKDVPTFFEANGRLRINSAGDLVPGTKQKTFQVYRIQKNVGNVPDWFLEWPGSVNSYGFTLEGKVKPERTMLLLPTERPQRTLENNVWYYPLVYSLRQDKDTYDVIEPSMGYHELYPVIELIKGKYVTKYRKQRITVGDPADYPKKPQFLTKQGFKMVLQEDKKKGGIDLSEVYIQERRDLDERDFSVLPVT